MIVLLRWADREDASPFDVTVHALLEDREALEKRLEKIREANRQYRMREIVKDLWRIGPYEDKGFFGNRALYFKAVEK